MRFVFKKSHVYLLATAFLLLVGFQNCARARFEKIDLVEGLKSKSGKVVNIKIQEGGYSTQEEVQVLLVIDTSPSMTSSIENLSKNIDSILNKIKYLDASVKIISTDEPERRARKQTKITYRKDNPSLPEYQEITKLKMQNQIIFKYNKNLSNQDLISGQIKSTILNLGQKGSIYEQPILAVAEVVGLDDFFKKDHPSLIYIITDEEDSSKNLELSHPYISKQKFITGSMLTIPDYYQLSFQRIGTEGGDSSEGSLVFPDLTLCQKEYNEYKNDPSNYIVKTCEYVNKPYGGFDIGASCADLPQLYQSGLLSEYQAAVYSKHTRCDDSQGGSWRIEDYISIMEGSYLYDQSVFKKYLDKKIGNRYLLAASINKPGQSCQLSQFQSYAQSILDLQSIFSPSQFLVASICSEKEISEHLDNVANKVEQLIEKKYSLILSAQEVVSKVIIVSKTGERRILDKSDYIIKDDAIEILNDTILKTNSDDHFEVFIDNI